MMKTLNSEKLNNVPKSSHAQREEKVLTFWKEQGIFEKSLSKKSPKGEFVFYEGPPTANGHPGIHHLEARAFKDAIPRYKTMRGYHVRRKGGWDTHGLPVELQVEKELGLKSKKEIETYGISAFNDKCKESVWKYVHEWEDFTNRMGYWVDLKDPYITYKPKFIESVWNVIKEADNKDLLYKDYKVVPWCPRCGTGLSSHELAQGYETVKDLSLYVKFRLKISDPDLPISLLAWTTTPWTLPGNVGLAIGEEIDYVKIRVARADIPTEILILAKDRFDALRDRFNNPEIIETIKGSELAGLSYEPLYPFLKDNVKGTESEKLTNAFKVYAADFVTTADGTGIVHLAPMYGQDDFEIGTKVGLPKYHLVNDDGTFKKETGFLAGAFVKDPNTDVAIIKDLAGRGLLFAKEKYEHTYPFCWRCHTPLIYFARDSWYIRMSELRKKLVRENKEIHWEPEHIKEGRFGEWLREVKDWAISRERYWGTPLPVWTCDTCHEKRVVGSVADIAKKPNNTYFVMRHGEAENNTKDIVSSDPGDPYHLTAEGRIQVQKTALTLKKRHIDMIIVSPFIRTLETADMVRNTLGLDERHVIKDSRIQEIDCKSWSGRSINDFYKFLKDSTNGDRFTVRPGGLENWGDVKKRMGGFIYDVDKQYEGKTILIVTHELSGGMLIGAARGLDHTQCVESNLGDLLKNAEVRPVDFSILPHNADFELDLHKPFIDAVKLPCKCGGVMTRAKEVMDVWFDSGSMPFAQDHYPFENKKFVEKTNYPADFISEAIDQTRGWFYTLHAVGTIMGKGRAYENVICLGHLLDEKGKKMSKSIGNIVNPITMMDKYGADALRFWMYSVNQPGDSKNFEEKTVDEVVKKVFNMVDNVLSFYKLYDENGKFKNQNSRFESQNVLDKWIIARLDQLVGTVTANLDAYRFMEPSRAIKDFVADLSQWYLQSSRDRFKGGHDGGDVGKAQAMMTLRYVLITLSKVMAPFAPFFAEYLYRESGGTEGGRVESVHLEDWPKVRRFDQKLLDDMETTRKIVEVALSLRSFKKIGVRQPLASLTYELGFNSMSSTSNSTAKAKSRSKIVDITDDFRDIVKDKLNVKNVISRKFTEPSNVGITEKDGHLFIDSGGYKVSLDTAITSALKEEGTVRELVRAIQDLRKQKGLTVSDKIDLKVETSGEGRIFIERNERAILSATSTKSISFANITGDFSNVGGLQLKLSIS